MQIRREIGEGVAAWIVVELVPPDESSEREHGGGTNQPRPRRCNVKSLNLRPLVCRTDRNTIGTQTPIVNHQPRPRRGVLGVEGIRRLEPGTGESQIHVDGVRVGELKVQAIEYVLFVTFGVYNSKLRWIEKPSAVQAVGRDEITPFLPSITEVKPCVGRAETAVRSGYLTMRRGKALSRAGGNVDHNARLLAEFGRWRTGNDLQRLDRIERNLV